MKQLINKLTFYGTALDPIFALGVSGNSNIIFCPEANMAIQVAWVGNARGTLSLEGSIDAISWAPLGGTDRLLDGVNDSHLWNISDIHYDFLRMVWAQTSSGGVLSGTFKMDLNPHREYRRDS